MTSDRKELIPVQDDFDDPETGWPACLDFPLSYGMGKYMDDDEMLMKDFSPVIEPEHQGLFWPWREGMTVLDARYMHVELDAMIEELASLESWPVAYRDAMQALAANSPLSALLPDVRHFTERLAAARAEAATREALVWLWRTERFDNRGLT